MRVLSIVATFGAAGGLLAACTAPAQSAAAGAPQSDVFATAPVAQAQPAPNGLRIILRLKDRRTPVDTQATLDHLGSLCAAQLTYVRSLADDAHVLILTPGPGRSADEALGLLRASRSVDYVEPDARRTAQ